MFSGHLEATIQLLIGQWWRDTVSVKKLDQSPKCCQETKECCCPVWGIFSFGCKSTYCVRSNDPVWDDNSWQRTSSQWHLSQWLSRTATWTAKKYSCDGRTENCLYKYVNIAVPETQVADSEDLSRSRDSGRPKPSCKSKASSKSKHSSKTSDKGSDLVLEYASETLTLGLLLMEFVDAIREGNGDRIIRCWRFFMLLFKASNRTNYSIEEFTLLCQFHFIFPECMKQQLVWSRTANTHGRPGKTFKWTYTWNI